MENPGQRSYVALILADVDELLSKIVGVNISTNNIFTSTYMEARMCLSSHFTFKLAFQYRL